jgi:3-hydroxypropanoate dehydrogenase
MPQLPHTTLAQVFTEARTFNTFSEQELPDALLHELYDLAKWGPTAFNAQPARFFFVRSADARARLVACLSPRNAEKTLKVPVTAIVAQDSLFFEHLPAQFPANPKAPDMYSGDAQLAETTALRNSSLQGAYLIVAARMLGLACGPMSGFNAAAVDEAFFPDGRYKTNFLVNLGYGDTTGQRPRGPRLGFDEAAQIL